MEFEKSVARDRGGIYLWDPKPTRLCGSEFRVSPDNAPATVLFYPITPNHAKTLAHVVPACLAGRQRPPFEGGILWAPSWVTTTAAPPASVRPALELAAEHLATGLHGRRPVARPRREARRRAALARAWSNARRARGCSLGAVSGAASHFLCCGALLSRKH